VPQTEKLHHGGRERSSPSEEWHRPKDFPKTSLLFCDTEYRAQNRCDSHVFLLFSFLSQRAEGMNGQWFVLAPQVSAYKVPVSRLFLFLRFVSLHSNAMLTLLFARPRGWPVVFYKLCHH
jgi:hypothetical protein